ncbi:NERD domain-containing protein [Enemella sp. A6]|uniref:nuclease-related domain-containing DEAD/DEAH box helicase n=1 Tax=Enemella sp. A6 TaxID=3440152 RepID=UPI003EC0EB2D
MWQRLVHQLRPEDVVLTDVNLIGPQQDHQIDFVVLMPGVGIMVVEVQGGRVFVKGNDWYLLDDRGDHRITPIGHALGNKFAVRKYVADDPRWNGRQLRFQHCLIAPDAEFSSDFAMPDCPRTGVHGAGDQQYLGSRLREILVHDHHNGRPPQADEVELIIEILSGRQPRPVEHGPEGPPALVTRLTADQARVLRTLRHIPRAEIRGTAGTGKSTLALTQARELTRGRPGTPAQRVALVCYSIGHGEHLKRAVAAAPAAERPAFVGTFEELGRSWGVSGADRTDSDFWEREFPEQVGSRVLRLAPADRFDSIVVDDGHDIADLWWPPLIAALRDEVHGGFFVYRDPNRHLYDRYAPPPLPLVPISLDQNLRNTGQIAATFAPLLADAGLPEKQGPAVRFVASGTTGVLDETDRQVQRLRNSGVAAGDILVLTTGSRHPQQVERQRHLGPDGYWEAFFAAEDVFHGHVLGCKGLERPTVVLCINEDETRDRATERFYVGCSRAIDTLVVVGAPEVAQRVGLNLPPADVQQN